MKIEDRRGQPIDETTITVDDGELYDLLEGLADLAEGKRDHIHFAVAGSSELVVRRAGDETEPIERQMDWWVGPLILFAVLFMAVGVVTVIRWAVGLM